MKNLDADENALQFRNLINLNLCEYDHLIKMAQLKLEKNDAKGSLELSLELKKYINDNRIDLIISKCYVKLNRSKEALEVLSIGRDLQYAQLILADQLREIKRYDKAIYWYEVVCNQKDRNNNYSFWALKNLGEVLFECGEWERSSECLTKAVQMVKEKGISLDIIFSIAKTCLLSNFIIKHVNPLHLELLKIIKQYQVSNPLRIITASVLDEALVVELIDFDSDFTAKYELRVNERKFNIDSQIFLPLKYDFSPILNIYSGIKSVFLKIEKFSNLTEQNEEFKIIKVKDNIEISTNICALKNLMPTSQSMRDIIDQLYLNQVSEKDRIKMIRFGGAYHFAEYLCIKAIELSESYDEKCSYASLLFSTLSQNVDGRNSFAKWIDILTQYELYSEKIRLEIELLKKGFDEIELGSNKIKDLEKLHSNLENKLPNDINLDFENGIILNKLIGSASTFSPKAKCKLFSNIKVDTSLKLVILISCDIIYFNLYIDALYDSLNISNDLGSLILHCNLIVQEDSVVETVDILRSHENSRKNFHWSISTYTDSVINRFGRKSYFTIGRFLILPEIMALYGVSILVTETDCRLRWSYLDILTFVNGFDIGLSLGSTWRILPGDKISAGVVYVSTSESAKDFANRLKEAIWNYSGLDNNSWNIDQVALNYVYDYFKNIELKKNYFLNLPMFSILELPNAAGSSKLEFQRK